MKAFGTIAFASLLFSCGGGVASQWVPLAPSSEEHAARSGEDVEIFTAQPPAKPYREIGILDVQRFPDDKTTAPELLEVLRTKAGVHGCDAVVLTAFDAIGTKWSKMSYRGTCIVYAATSAGD